MSTSTPTVGIGGTATLKAVAKPVTGTLLPTGTVTFREGTAITGTVSLALVRAVQTAKLDVPGLAVGNHTFIATYNGSVDFSASTSLPVTIVVTVVAKSATTTTSTSSTPTPAPGQDTKFKAVIKQVSGTIKPTGTVTFTEGATLHGTVPLTLVGTVETAKLTVPGLAAGTHVITASYTGSAAFNPSSSTVTVTVVKASTTCTLTATPSTTTPGKTALVALVRPVAPATGVATGIVNYVVDTNTPQPFALSPTARAQFNVTFVVGTTHTARITYAGDSMFNGCTGGPVSFTS